MRQLNTWLAFTSYCRATTDTDAPGTNDAATISRFSASGHDRCRRLSRKLVPIIDVVDTSHSTVATKTISLGQIQQQREAAHAGELNGHSQGLSQETLARICAAFPGITLEALIGGRAVPGTPATATGPVPLQAGTDEVGTPTSSDAQVAAADGTASRQGSVPPGARPAAGPRREESTADAFDALSMSLHGLRGALMAVERMCRQLAAALKARDPRM